MRINFDFGDLEAFLALMESGSFVRAAEALNLSQSAFSRRLQKLETALNATLFVRTTRAVRPTLVAREFHERAAALLAEADEAVRALAETADRFEHQRRAIVTVAAIPTATRSLLPRCIERFRREGHTARIRIADLSANAVLEAVAGGEADFGINFIGAQEPGLDFHFLMEDPFVLAMPVGDPMAGSREVRWRDIDPDRFIGVWKGSGNRMLIDAALAREHVELAWAYEVRHLSTALELVEAGLGMTALPRSSLPPAGHPLVEARPLIEPGVSRAVGVVRRAGARLSAMSEAFYGVLREQTVEDLAGA